LQNSENSSTPGGAELQAKLNNIAKECIGDCASVIHQVCPCGDCPGELYALSVTLVKKSGPCPVIAVPTPVANPEPHDVPQTGQMIPWLTGEDMLLFLNAIKIAPPIILVACTDDNISPNDWVLGKLGNPAELEDDKGGQLFDALKHMKLKGEVTPGHQYTELSDISDLMDRLGGR